MGTSVERHGFTNCIDLMRSLVADLITGGMTLIYPTSTFNPLSDKKVVLEAGTTVDSLQPTQAWRIYIEAVDEFKIQVNVATPTQLTSTGNVPLMSQGMGSVTNETVGFLGQPGGTPTYWISRDKDKIDATNEASYPMSYRMATSDHGIAIFVWYDATDNRGNKFSWICVQRSVDPQTGTPYVTGKSPVYCVFGYAGLIKKFIVREADVLKPSPAVDATVNSEDSKAIINVENQVCITEDNKYIITFPNGLNTPRCAYTHELDMIATTSADVISQWADVPLTVYSEQNPRMYKAMSASGANNTGMRLLMIEQGPSTTPHA